MRVLFEGVCSGSVKTVEQVRDYIMQTLLATTVAYESVHTAAKGALEYLEANRFVDWDREKEVFVPTQLGQATVESALSPDEALILLHELSNAQTRFVFTEDLHLVYHCTPLFSGVDPDWTFFEKLFLRLPPNLLGVADAIGIDESFLALAARAPPKKDATSPQLITHRRFYVSLILFDVVREIPLQGLTEKYGLARADIQRLMEQASSFAGMASTFCDKLNWWFFPPLIDKMASRLQRGVEQELLPLMKISGLSAWRARELYRKGYRTVASIALASESELEQVLLARGQQFRVSVAPSAPVAAPVSSPGAMASMLRRAAKLALQEEAGELTDAMKEITDTLGPPNASQPMLTPEAAKPQNLVDTPVSRAVMLTVADPATPLVPKNAPPAIFSPQLQRGAPPKEGNLCEDVDCLCSAEWERFLAAVTPLLSGGDVIWCLQFTPVTSVGFHVVLAAHGHTWLLRHPKDPCYRKRLRDSDQTGAATLSAPLHLAYVREHFLLADIVPKVMYEAQSMLKKLVDYGLLSIDDVARIQNLQDPLIADWMISPDDRPQGRVASVDMLCQSHGVAPLQMPTNRVSEVCLAAARCLQVMDVLRFKLRMNGLLSAFMDVEMPLVPVLLGMELYGITFDDKLYTTYITSMKAKARLLEEQAYAEARCSNWSLESPKDCAKILFDVLSLPSLASTSDTKYFPGRRRRKAFLRETRSTKASVLHALTRAFPHVAMPAIIGQHRTMQGWVEKYLQPLLSAAIASPEKRIYGHFLQTATATGRLSMNEPNLQTIPKPIAFTLGNAEHSIRPRKAFVASHNCVLLSADYSQIEVRLLAHFSEDPALLSAFRSGGDVFKRLSSAVTGKPIEEVTPSERAQAKTLCYGMVYGKGVASIAEDLEITEAEAEGVLNSFRACYPVAMSFISEYCLQSA